MDRICEDLNLVWTSTFTLLVVTFNSRIENMTANYEEKFNKVDDLIIKWKKRMLTLPGRVMIAKCILLSQYIYLFQTIEMKYTMLEKIQVQLNDFIRGDTTRKWISREFIERTP